MRVSVGDGASMPLPDDKLEHTLRYAGKFDHSLEAAEVVAAYLYLVLKCSRDEAWRRIKLIRVAAAKRQVAEAEKSVA